MRVSLRKKPIQAEKIDLLVHPFGCVLFSPEKPIKLKEKDVKFMAGLWGKKINEVAKDPKRIMILVQLTTLESFPYFKQLNRFVNYAQLKLGERLIPVKGSLSEAGQKELIEEFKRRGIVVDPSKVEGNAYGEVMRGCVRTEKEHLCRLLGIKKFFSDPWLSIQSDKLSSYNRNLKKQSRQLRNLRRKLRRRQK